MSEYRHFIAYIYEYEDGRKKKNAGFVKIHIRNGMCQMQIKFQTGKRENDIYEICGFVHEQQWNYAIPVGKLQSRNGICEGRIAVQETIFLEQGYSFGRVSGLWIRRETQPKPEMFLTVWDEQPVDSRFLVTELPKETNTEGTEPEETKPEERKSEEPDRNRAGSEALGKAETGTKKTGRELEAQDSQRELAGGEQRKLTRKKWEQFQYHYPHVNPFEDDEITECISITPKDVAFLGEGESVYAACPFVQQKYMKYRHLLLGMHKNGQYILAVPGVNRGTQDRNLAAMYGFPEYKISDKEVSGYWFHFINEKNET